MAERVSKRGFIAAWPRSLFLEDGVSAVRAEAQSLFCGDRFGTAEQLAEKVGRLRETDGTRVQGLKPTTFVACVFGPAEAVPLLQNFLMPSFSASCEAVPFQSGGG